MEIARTKLLLKGLYIVLEEESQTFRPIFVALGPTEKDFKSNMMVMMILLTIILKIIIRRRRTRRRKEKEKEL